MVIFLSVEWDRRTHSSAQLSVTFFLQKKMFSMVSIKVKLKNVADSSPPEEIITAQTFELGRNSEELILVAPDL